MTGTGKSILITNNMKKVKLFLLIIGLILPFFCQAMPVGTLLYRTSSNGKMYGYSGDPLIYAEKGIIKNIYSGHVAIYIGQENGEDYIVEALADGVVKTPAKYFINSSLGEKFLGARIPKKLSAVQRARIVEIAKSLVGKQLGYDFDFKKQKGPDDGDWTCVGLVEKIYESADISNPNNLGALEYDPSYYAVNITPDGFDNYSRINEEGDCFSSDYEFSKIARRKNLLIPAPELIGFDAGLEYNGERYIFLPYTQFLQPTLKDVDVDIQISSDFQDEAVRGKISVSGLILRWSLINNPWSSIKRIVQGIKNLTQKIFDSSSNSEIVINSQESKETANPTISLGNKGKKTNSSAKEIKRTEPLVQVNKKVVTSDQSTDEQKKVTIASEVTVPDETKSSLEDAEPVSEIELADLYFRPEVKINTSTPLNNLDTSSSSPIYIINNITTPASDSVIEEVVEDWPRLAIIQQVYATGDNDWVRLYNPTEHDFDLAEAEYRLEKSKTAENPSLLIRIGNPDDGVYPGGTVIKSKGSYLIVRDDANDYYRSQADAISSRSEFSWTGSGYTIYLGVGAISSSTDPDIIDALGFGETATYFQGEGPALEITDNYILDRIDESGNNNLDFSLILSDDPSIEIVATSTATSTNSTTATSTATTTATSTANLYLPFTPIDSPDISHLWHFDECYGIGKYNVGKWDCAQEISFNTDNLIINLEPIIESSSFSMAFYYRKTAENPRLDFQLKNSLDKTLRLLLENGKIQIEGLPNSQWRYYDDNYFSVGWHQVVLSINRDENFWSVYLDGQEKIKEEFIETLPGQFNQLTIISDT